MARNRTGHARRRSHVATGLMAVVGTGVVIGLGLGYSERPVGLCVLAIAGLIVVLLCLTVLRTPLALLFSTLAGRHGAHFVQGPIVRVGLWVLLLLVSLVAVLWPATLPWTLFAALALLGAIASVELLRLHPDMGVRKVPLDKAAGPRWAWRGLLGLSAAWFMELVPGQAMHAVGGPVAEPPSAALASAFGDLEHRIMARFDRQDEMLAEQGEKLDRALALLEERESEVRRLPAGDDAPPGPPPLSPQDRAILDAAKPFANALTRYRIAVAEGDDALAGELEEEVLAQRDTKRADEDFLFERARGDRHFNAGRFDQAIPAYRAALAVREGDPAVLNNLAVALLRGRGNTDHGAALHEAESLLARSLDIRRHMHEGDHADVTLSLNNLAAVRQALGRAGEAEPLYEQALAMRRRLFEGDHPDVALSLNNLAFVRQALGRGGEAEPLYEQALAIQRRLFEGDHPDVAMSINNLAGVREALGRAVEAEPLFEEALAMRRRLFEGDDPDVASSLNNLASVRESLGRAGEAEPLYAEALAMYRRLFEGDHPDVASSLNNLASVQEALGRVGEAERLYEEALTMQLRLFEGDHPHVAVSLNNLAGVRWALGRAGEAERLYEEALAMQRRLFEGDHPHVARSLNNIAFVRRALGRVSEAETLYAEALAMRRRLFEGDHPDVASSLNNLADVREALGRAGEAEPLYVDALAMYRRLFEGDHPDVAMSLNNLAVFHGEQGRWKVALPLAEEALAMGGRCLPAGHPDLQLWKANLALIRERLDH